MAHEAQAGPAKKAGGARIYAGLVAITKGYAIGHCTHLEKEIQAKAKQRAGRLERIMLKEKVDLVLAKGQTPPEGRWNNTDLNVMIQWYKRDGDNAMPKNKDGLLLRYRETHTRAVDDTSTYPHKDVETDAALATAVTTVATTHSRPRMSATTARSAPTGTARSSDIGTTQSSVLALKKIALAAAGDPAASHVAPAPGTTSSGTNMNAKSSATLTEMTVIITRAMASPADVGPNPKQSPAISSRLDWGIEEATFDVGIYLDMDAPAMPLCHMDCDNDDSISDDGSIFVDLSRD
jgi:hypothetical protein